MWGSMLGVALMVSFSVVYPNILICFYSVLVVGTEF